MKVENVIFESGERFPMLIDEDGVPDFWTTLYTSQRLRLSHTQSSIIAFLRSMIHFQKWQQIQQRDVIAEFRQQRLVSLNDIESLKEFCSLSDEYVSKALHAKPKRKVVKMNDFRLPSSPLSIVGNDLQKRRLHDIAVFLNFVGREILKRKNNAATLLEFNESMLKSFKSFYPRSRNKSYRARLEQASKESFEAFIKVFDPESKDNPFKGYDNKLRNYLLVQLLYWTGARSGEIISLTVDDVDYDIEHPSVTINRRHDDPYDSRKLQPVTKTKSRKVQIPPALVDDLDYYINKVRSRYRQSKKHPYIFVSHKGKTSGQPISDVTFNNRVIGTVKSINPELFKLVRRHGFRHYFNERLSDQIDAHNKRIDGEIAEAEAQGLTEQVKQLKSRKISHQQEVDMRADLMGHVSKDSARPYLERHVKRKANQVHKEMMEQMSRTVREQGERP